MFVRVRQTASRLQASLVETRRVDGKLRHEHVASLGSITLSPTVAERIGFWARLHERLAKLSNRIAPEVLGKILGDLHERVPMVSIDEQRALQIDNAKVYTDQWSADHVQLVVKATEVANSSKAMVAEASVRATVAQGRVEAIRRSEPVTGDLVEPEDFAAILKAAGWTKADLQYARLLATMPKEHFKKEFLEANFASHDKGKRRRSTHAALAILRKYGER